MPRAQVFAFEANPEIHRLHHERLRDAGVDSHHLAINDRSGETTVFAPRTLAKAWAGPGDVVDAVTEEPIDTGKTSLLRRNENATYAEFRVPAQSLDDFFRGESDRRCALWIDVEGAASAVLSGATEILSSTAVIHVEVEQYPFWKEQKNATQVAQQLRAHGFLPVARDQEYGDDQFNTLWLRAEHHHLVDAELYVANSADYPPRGLPVLIPSFNNPTYLRAMIAQLLSIGLENLIIVDNASEFSPHLRYLAALEKRFIVVRQPENSGPRALVRTPQLFDSLPQFFCITDPDLEFHPRLPPDFVQHLIDLTCTHRVGKAGFALDISTPEAMQPHPYQIGEERLRIWEWEAQFWRSPIEPAGDDPAYRARLDTTFAVYNKEYFDLATHLEGIRVAGRYTARHLPWYREHHLPPEEAAFYRATSKHSFYFGTPPRS
ncbi:hypothetical protein BH20VER1_BH20VER1_30730 [soil metagenome]